MRYLALDYGRKRIGVAVSDPLGITAQPVGMFEMSPKIFAQLLEVIKEREVTDLVMGYPRALTGEPSPMAREVEAFAGVLKDRLHLPIHYWNERFSSAESERLLIEANVRREKRKEVRDIVAATIILQGFLNAQHPHIPSEN